MKTYRITRTYQYTETLEFNAPDKYEAMKMAEYLEDDFVRNYDDILYNQEVKEM